jgi:Gpi18-like mannosyltransferase
MNKREILILLGVIVAAFFIRLYFVPVAGYAGDVFVYKEWSKAAVSQGVNNMDTSYPPVYMYVLKGIGMFYKHFVPSFASDTYLFTLLVKLPSILSDILISLIIFFFIKKRSSFKVGLFIAMAYAFNPAVIFDSAYWGQTDSFLILISLCSILALVYDNCFLAIVLAVVALLTKFQAAVLLPFIFLVIWQRHGAKRFFGGMIVAWGAFVATLAPYFYLHKVERVITMAAGAVGDFAFLSLYAFNVWWIYGNGQARGLPDTNLFFGLASCRLAGIIFFLLFIILLLHYLYQRVNDERAIFFSTAMAYFAFYMLTTEMHERYIMFPLIFLLLAAFNDKKLMGAFIAFSFSAWVSLMCVLYWTYPLNIFAFPLFKQPFLLGMSLAILNVAIFAYCAYLIIHEGKIKLYPYLIALVVLLIAASAKAWLPPRPVYLSDLSPRFVYQEWGTLHKDSSVGGNELIADGLYFHKGLGTHAHSVIEYDLNGRYSTLDGAVAVDDEASNGNLIDAWIICDGQVRYFVKGFSGWILPRYFHINIKGVKILRLEVTDGGDTNNRDHADWLNIKVLP